MNTRKKGAKKPQKNAKIGQVASSSDSETYWLRNTLVGIPAGVAIIVLGAWIIPLSGYVNSHLLPSSKKNSAAPPVAVAIRKANPACGGAWMVHGPLSALPKTPTADDADWTPWVKAAGAADADFTYATITIQGRFGQKVYLTGINFNVKRSPPIRGIMVGPPCGGPVTGRYVEADLDQRPARITGSSSGPDATVGATPNDYKPLTFPYEISNTEGLVLIIAGVAKKYDDVWSADILWSSDGVNGQARIDDNGVPFETSPSRYQTEMVSCVGCEHPIISHG